MKQFSCKSFAINFFNFQFCMIKRFHLKNLNLPAFRDASLLNSALINLLFRKYSTVLLKVIKYTVGNYYLPSHLSMYMCVIAEI